MHLVVRSSRPADASPSSSLRAQVPVLDKHVQGVRHVFGRHTSTVRPHGVSMAECILASIAEPLEDEGRVLISQELDTSAEQRHGVREKVVPQYLRPNHCIDGDP